MRCDERVEVSVGRRSDVEFIGFTAVLLFNNGCKTITTSSKGVWDYIEKLNL